MKFTWLLVLSTVFLASCEHIPYHLEAEKQKIYIFNDTVLSSAFSLENHRTKQRMPLEFDNGLMVSSCFEYDQYSREARLTETVSNFLHKSDYLLCDALQLVSKKKIVNLVPPSISAEKLVQTLDVKSFPSSLYQAVTDSATPTLALLFTQDLHYESTVATLNRKNWVFSLEIVAATDINHNGELDWIVWVTDESKQGDYGSYQTIIVHDPKDQSLNKATVYPNIL